jgi:hypothetical protein
MPPTSGRYRSKMSPGYRTHINSKLFFFNNFHADYDGSVAALYLQIV